MSVPGGSWGRYMHASQRLVRLIDRSAPLPPAPGSALPYGNGRSYGDSCLNDHGTLFCCRGLDRFVSFDTASGVLHCEAGVLLSEILELAVPQGWFLPVTPGTRFVTVGGAIANDVHGKNHHRAGSFGNHVIQLELLRTDGSRIVCGPEENIEFFAATVGGLGLTGVITRATIQLRRIASSFVALETIKFESLAEFAELSGGSEENYEYTVAWVDCTGRAPRLGRGIFSRANHAPALAEGRAKRQHSLPVPFSPPVSLVNAVSLRAFNTLYYHRQRSRVARSIQHYEPFFYPLDGLLDWNRMYGPRGFLQYQCVVPDLSGRTVESLLDKISRAGEGSFLAVLKQFGRVPPRGMLSFPRPGTTLALDFPNRGEKTLRLLDHLDDIVEAAGGAVYPAKDARMSASRFRRYFPNCEAFEAFRDPGLSSSFWRRVME